MDPNQAIESFDYFVGKVCSIHTRPTNWKLSVEQTPDYYVGVVNSVTECGICITNVINNKKTFIMMPSVIAIAEETVADPLDPDDQKMLRDYEEKKKEVYKNNPRIHPPQTQTQIQSPPPFVDIASLSRQVQAARQNSK